MSAGSTLEFDGENSSMNTLPTTACETDLFRLLMSRLIQVQCNQPRAASVCQDKSGRTPT